MTRSDVWLRRSLTVALWLLLWAFGLPSVPVSGQESNCTISATGVAFGTYDVFQASPDDSTGQVTYRCNKNRSITIDISRGSSSTYSQRTMKQGALTLNYNLYLDALRTSIWGSGSNGTSHYSANAPGNTTVNVTIYGRIPAKQNAQIGNYSDTLTVTITF